MISHKKAKIKLNNDGNIDNNKIINQKNLSKKNQVIITKSKNLIKFKNYNLSFKSKNMKTRLCFFIFKA